MTDWNFAFSTGTLFGKPIAILNRRVPELIRNLNFKRSAEKRY